MKIKFKLFLFLLILSCQTNTPKTLSIQERTEQILAGADMSKEKLQQLIFCAYKSEEKLEVWGRTKGTEKFKQLTTYPFCVNSGTLGPKRREGDLQIPEGLYEVDRFNPQSKFHLSLGINYPNSSDRLLGHPETPGSDIFIHGGCASVGCISIGDEAIEEVYDLATAVRANKIPVYIFPFRMTAERLQIAALDFPEQQGFWSSLQAAYEFFETHRTSIPFQFSADGLYVVLTTD